MEIRILQSGDAMMLVIPRYVAEAAGLRPGAVVDASVREGLLVLGTGLRPKYLLEELLAGITE